MGKEILTFGDIETEKKTKKPKFLPLKKSYLSNRCRYWENISINKTSSGEKYHKEIPKVGSNHTCWAVINLDSDLKKDENYYLQVFLRVYIH